MKPAAGQVWKAPAPRVHGGYRYVRILEVRHGYGSPYVNVIEVGKEGQKVRPSKAHPFRAETFTIQLEARAMPSPYTKEEAIF